eukprot:TRINITY_DN2461_c0_g1_i1.p1 TRINITY_DN2461_c0_g1~~TRINITY_DN2461_c0_g1_i1.p1  ORF type:complete len:185 (-),score=61.52 TRINITY_DN2461_c0_g1_i1:98-652(-)
MLPANNLNQFFCPGCDELYSQARVFGNCSHHVCLKCTVNSFDSPTPLPESYAESSDVPSVCLLCELPPPPSKSKSKTSKKKKKSSTRSSSSSSSLSSSSSSIGTTNEESTKEWGVCCPDCHTPTKVESEVKPSSSFCFKSESSSSSSSTKYSLSSSPNPTTTSTPSSGRKNLEGKVPLPILKKV